MPTDLNAFRLFDIYDPFKWIYTTSNTCNSYEFTISLSENFHKLPFECMCSMMTTQKRWVFSERTEYGVDLNCNM